MSFLISQGILINQQTLFELLRGTQSLLSAVRNRRCRRWSSGPSRKHDEMAYGTGSLGLNPNMSIDEVGDLKQT